MSPYGGYLIQKNLDDRVNASLHYVDTVSNVTYGMYETGYYHLDGGEDGHPCPGYPGYAIVMNDGSLITKFMILINAYCYTMSQSAVDATQVYTAWTRV